MDYLRQNIVELVSLEYKTTEQMTMNHYHFHNTYEIYYSLSPGIEVWFGNSYYVTRGRDLLLFGTNDMHRIYCPPCSEYKRYILYFSPLLTNYINTRRTDLIGLFTSRSKDYNRFVVLEEHQDSELRKLFDEMGIALKNESSYAGDIRVRICLLNLLIYINCLFNSLEPLLGKEVFENPMFSHIKPLLEYVEKNYDQRLDVSFLANQYDLSRTAVNKLFKTVTGLSFHQYLVCLRISKARAMLEGGKDNIMEVCLDSGFNDYTHFIRSFRKTVGMPPKKYAGYFLKYRNI